MGHRDELVIADAGLPIPEPVQRIDLALTENVPRFLDALRVVLSELQVESATVAEEMGSISPSIYEQIEELLGDIPIQNVSHEQFKHRTHSSKAVIRTGEFTPYANIILVAGVVF
jgi:D-ribose pyranase